MSEGPDSERFMARVEALLAHGDVSLTQGESLPLSPLGAGILVAVEMGLADSRGFARALGVEHALVLREIALLSGPQGLITVTGRHPKTLRTSFELSPLGARLLNERCEPLDPTVGPTVGQTNGPPASKDGASA